MTAPGLIRSVRRAAYRRGRRDGLMAGMALGGLLLAVGLVAAWVLL